MSGRLRPALVGLCVSLTGCASEECLPPPPPEAGLGELSAWERRMVEGSAFAPAPGAEYLAGEEGVPLAYREWFPLSFTGDGTVVLLVHGSSAHSGLYTMLGAGLAQRGVAARLVDLRGHGLSVCAPPGLGGCGSPEDAPRAIEEAGTTYYPGRPGDSHDASQIIRDVAQHLGDLRARWPEASIVLAGHSSGGGVVSRYVEHHGMTGLDGAILLAPFNHADQPQNRLERYDCGKEEGNGYARVDLGALGAALRGAVHRYVLTFHKVEPYTDPLDILANSFTTMLGMQVDDPDRFHEAFTRPVLWVAAEHDVLLDLEASRAELGRLPGGGAFVVAQQTSHIGLTWSDAVAGLMASFATSSGPVESGVLPPPAVEP